MRNFKEMGKKSAIIRGYTFYGDLRKKYPTHFISWRNMFKRSKESGLPHDPDFSRTVDGFFDFIKYLGPIPENMIKPTIGRKDHSVGYMKGNFEWQESIENIRESCSRNEFWKKGKQQTETHKKGKELEDYLLSMNSIPSIEFLMEKFSYSYKKDLYYGIRTAIIKNNLPLLLVKKSGWNYEIVHSHVAEGLKAQIC
jgi:hypothetical protein